MQCDGFAKGPRVTPLLSINGITKAYPGVVANDDVSFTLMPGEIHALLGENGAGKSTLVKTIYGLVRPDAGSMMLGGKAFQPSNPQAARAAGIGMVFQHFSLFEAMSVAENIALGMTSPPDRRELSRSISETSARYGLEVDPFRQVGDLSVGERQRVEIIRCLLQQPRVLIMDEPTSVLTPQEVWTLFETLRQLSAEGVAILYISHKLEEIRALCDRATILRGGKVVASCTPVEETAQSLAEMMIGQSMAAPAVHNRTPGDLALDVQSLNVKSDDPFGVDLKDISFSLMSGQILGVAGVAGNGQDELMLALSGETLVTPETLFLGRRDISVARPNERRVSGLLCAPEERLGHAAAPAMSLTDNAFLTGNARERLSWNGFIKSQVTSNFARAIIAGFDVRTPGPTALAGSLSGGNLQKFLMGREIMQRPRVLVVNQPTWGVDAKAAGDIRRALSTLADEGAGVIVISQDLDELMEVADVFSVIAGGRLSEPVKTGSISIEEIGLMMGGDASVTQQMEALHVDP